MVNPYRWQSPDARLRHLAYARQREDERTARLDALDNQRLQRIQQDYQVEQERSGFLDRQDTIAQEMRVEQERSRELDESMAKFREVEQRPPTPPVSEWMPQRDEAAALRAERPSGLMGTIEDVFRQTGRIAGGPEYEEAFLPSPRGLAPPLPRSVSAVGLSEEERWGARYWQLLEEEFTKREELFGSRPAEGTPSYIQAERNAEAKLYFEQTGEKFPEAGAAEPTMLGQAMGGPFAAPTIGEPLTEAAEWWKGEVARPIARVAVEPLALATEAAQAVAPARVPGIPSIRGVTDVGITPGELRGEVSVEAMSWITDPINLAFFIGPEIRVAKAAMRGARLTAQESKILRGATAKARQLMAEEAGAVSVPGGRLRPATPEGMKLINDIPSTTAIRQRLTQIDAELAKPKVTGGRDAMLKERARVQAQSDIDDILASGRPVEDQLDLLSRELDELQTEAQLRSVPFRGRWKMAKKFVPPEKETRMGAPTAEEFGARPSAARRREAQAAVSEQRYPELSSPELDARERTFREFVQSAKFEPVEEPLVGRARFTPEGEVMAEPTYATEAELAGYRGEQARLPMGAGERPIETAGPMFERPRPGEPVPMRPAEAVPPPREPPERFIEQIVHGADAPPPGQPPVRGFAEAASIPPESAGGRFVAPLRGFEEVMGGVVTRDDIVGRFFARTGINPALTEGTPVGRSMTTYLRQRVAVEELVEVAISGSLDVHAQRFTGRMGGVFSIGDDTFIKNLPGKVRRTWMDAFSDPKTKFAPAQQAYVDDYLQVVREAEEMRVAAGLQPRGLNKEGWFYVPRQVKRLKDIELHRPSNPSLQRMYEEAQEGVAAGVRYNESPRAVLEMHLRNAYREVLEKQLTDALTPLSVRPTELLRRTNPRVVVRMEKATDALTRANREVRRLRVPRVEKAGPVTAEEKALRKTLTGQRQSAQTTLEAAKAEFYAARTPYRRATEAVRKREVGPGNLFGKAEENISIGQWRNRFFPQEDIKLLTDGLGSFGVSAEKVNFFARGVELLANYIRFLASVGDFAAPFIQGLPFAVRRPGVWGHATLRHYQAFLDPAVQSRFIREHIGSYQKLAQHGVPVGDPEFFAALRPGQGISTGPLLKRLPKGQEVSNLLRMGGKQSFGRFQSSYNTFLGSSRALLLEGMEAGFKGSEDDLFSLIANLTGGLDARALGVGPSQRAVEGFFLAFSPRLLRSTVALVSDLRLGPLHPKGRAAWEALGSLTAGATGLYVASGLALGKDWDQIKDGLNPLNGRKFLSHEINGDWVGIGGQVRAIIQALAYTGRAAATGDIDAFKSTNILENPLIRTWYFRGAPGVNVLGGAAEALLGGKIDVLPFDDIDSLPGFLAHLGTSALPFSIQGKIEGGNWTSVPFEVAGGRTTPELLSDAFERKTGLNYSETPAARRREIISGDPGLRRVAERYRTGLGETAERIGTDRSAELLPLAQAVLRGVEGAGENYNEHRPTIMARSAGVSEEAFKDLDIKPKGRDNELVEEYYSVDFMKDRNGDGNLGDPEDTRLAIEERDGILAKMSVPVRKALENPANFFPDPEVVEVERMRDEAIERLRELREITPFKGLTPDESQIVTDFLGEAQTTLDDWYYETHEDFSLSQAIAALGEWKAEEEPSPPGWRWAWVAGWAEALRPGTKSRKELVNPAYDQFIIDNTDPLLRIFPWVANYLSREQKAELPEEMYELATAGR